MNLKLTPIEFYEQYTQEDFKKKEFDQSRIEKEFDLSLIAKKYLKAKSLPKEWGDEMIINFFKVFIYRGISWTRLTELKYMQEKYFPLFWEAHKKLIQIFLERRQEIVEYRGAVPPDSLFFTGFTEAEVEQMIRNGTNYFPSYSDFMMRLSFSQEVHHYVTFWNFLKKTMEKNDKILPYSQNKNFIKHLFGCMDKLKYGVGVFGDFDFDHQLYCASIVCLLFSKDEKINDFIYHILDVKTPRLHKSKDIYTMHGILIRFAKINVKNHEMLNYLVEHYPEKWLKTYVWEQETEGDPDIYSYDPQTDSRIYVEKV
jgi:hypothetical protein